MGATKPYGYPESLSWMWKESFLRKVGKDLILMPRSRSWDEYFAGASRLSDDFPDTIEELSLQERDSL